MSQLGFLVAALFLPLFPLSIVFNRLFYGLRNPWLRIVLLLVWPQLGVLALVSIGESPPHWLVYWAVFSAALYAFRALVLRDLAIWTAHMATSAWSLLWVMAMFDDGGSRDLALLAAALSVPFLLLAWIIARLESVFGAAYAGTYGGLAQTVPRFSAVLTLTILAAVATPLFPGFFALLATVAHALPIMPWAAIVVLVIWMLWAWSGTRMTRGLVVGPACVEAKPDLSTPAFVLLGLAIAALAIGGVSSAGYLL